MNASTRDLLGSWLGRVLRLGSIASFAIIALGLGATFVAGRDVPAVDAVIGAGIAVLALTPAAALVAASFILWRAGERGRSASAALVLGLLAVSVAIGMLSGLS
jgi:hypothetical protein